MQTALHENRVHQDPATLVLDALVRRMAFLEIAMILLLSGPLLTTLGWSFADETGPGYQKFHPAMYLVLASSAIALLTFQMRYWEIFKSPRYGLFVVSVLALTVYSALVNSTSSGANGVFGLAATTFLIPALLLISMRALSRKDMIRIGIVLRGVVILNSLVGIFERLTHIEVVFKQEGYLWRSGGLFGHPLASALLTGMMLVYLLSANNRRGSLASAMPEVFLHVIAMFTFASRSGLLLAPIVIAIGALLPNSGSGEKISVGRRAAVVLTIIAAIVLTQLPLPFVQGALSRFTSDSASSETRTAAFQILGALDRHQLMWGVNYATRTVLQMRYDTPAAIEISWIGLILSLGLVILLPMVAGLLLATFSTTRKLDRSATLVAIYFFITVTGSSSISSKSLQICYLFIFILTLCQPRVGNLQPARTAPSRSAARPRPLALARSTIRAT